FAGHTVNGEVEAHDLGADVEAYTVNGSIHVSTSGVARAHTVNGSITAVMGRADWSDELEFKTVNGGIDLTFPAGLSAEVEAKAQRRREGREEVNEEKKMIGKRFMFCLLALAALALTAADASRAQSSRPEVTEEFHQTYPLAAGGRVSLSNINGGVRVAAWDRNEVKVDAVKRAYAQERLQEARIEVDSSPSFVHIETKY